jgi:hypothetical protein
MEEKQISEQESLQLITEMIQKAKRSFHESGTAAILWGAVVAVCGLVSFAELQWHFSIGFDVWILTLVAVLPQIVISIRERRQRRVLTHNEAVLNHVWIVYAISIFALVLYLNIIPDVTDQLLTHEGAQVMEQDPATGLQKPFHYFTASSGSLFLLLYAIPTLITALTYRFRPMLIGAFLCYGFFIVSLFTPLKWDMLLQGLSAIANWLIPGLLLHKRYFAQQKAAHVQ